MSDYLTALENRGIGLKLRGGRLCLEGEDIPEKVRRVFDKKYADIFADWVQDQEQRISRTTPQPLQEARYAGLYRRLAAVYNAEAEACLTCGCDYWWRESVDEVWACYDCQPPDVDERVPYIQQAGVSSESYLSRVAAGAWRREGREKGRAAPTLGI